jgi:hypothetical protein
MKGKGRFIISDQGPHEAIGPWCVCVCVFCFLMRGLWGFGRRGRGDFNVFGEWILGGGVNSVL